MYHRMSKYKEVKSLVFVLDLITVLVDDRGVLREIVHVVVGAFTLTVPNCKSIRPIFGNWMKTNKLKTVPSFVHFVGSTCSCSLSLSLSYSLSYLFLFTLSLSISSAYPCNHELYGIWRSSSYPGEFNSTWKLVVLCPYNYDKCAVWGIIFWICIELYY